MVEAGGVEPPSENARNEESTCVDDSVGFGRRFWNRQAGAYLARLISNPKLRTEAPDPIPLNDAHHPARGLTGGSALT